MKWVLILTFWTTNPPQDSFKFYTEVFDDQATCEYAIQKIYDAAFNKGVQAQAICRSQAQLKLLGPAV